MAGHPYNNSQRSEMDRIQARNCPHTEPQLPLGHKLFVPPGSDAPIGGVGSSAYGSMAMRSNDHPSSSYICQYQGHRAGNPGTSHSSYAHYRPAGSSNSYIPNHAHPGPALSYPQGSDEGFVPVSSQVDNRRVALKRKNPVIPPMDGMSVGGYYAGSSSNPQFSNYVQPNAMPVPESRPPAMPLNIPPSHWNDHLLAAHEGSQRNVRGRHNHTTFPLEPSPAAAYASNNIRLPPFHSNASAPSVSMPVEWNRAPVSVAPRIVTSGTPVSNSITLRERLYYPAPQSTNLNAPVPTLRGPPDSALFAHGGYAPRAIPHDAVPSYPPPPSAATSSRAVSHEAIPSYPPATSAATSTSVRTGQPFPVESAASFRHPRHVSTGHSSSGRSRRTRNSYYGFHPLLVEDNALGRWACERFMMLDQLIIYEPREAFDPHWDMRLDVDDMSYEELLALEERIGDVNTGLANEKISGCVTEVVFCSSDHNQNDQEDESCMICLEEYKDKDSLGRLKCGHNFHTDCIKKWLQVKNSCPVCKGTAAEDTRGSK